MLMFSGYDLYLNDTVTIYPFNCCHKKYRVFRIYMLTSSMIPIRNELEERGNTSKLHC